MCNHRFSQIFFSSDQTTDFHGSFLRGFLGGRGGCGDCRGAALRAVKYGGSAFGEPSTSVGVIYSGSAFGEPSTSVGVIYGGSAFGETVFMREGGRRGGFRRVGAICGDLERFVFAFFLQFPWVGACAEVSFSFSIFPARRYEGHEG